MGDASGEMKLASTRRAAMATSGYRKWLNGMLGCGPSAAPRQALAELDAAEVARGRGLERGSKEDVYGKYHHREPS